MLRNNCGKTFERQKVINRLTPKHLKLPDGFPAWPSVSITVFFVPEDFDDYVLRPVEYTQAGQTRLMRSVQRFLQLIQFPSPVALQEVSPLYDSDRQVQQAATPSIEMFHVNARLRATSKILPGNPMVP